MSARIAARIAKRELRGGLKGFRVFLACLALGVAAIAAVGTVRESIERGMVKEGATILGGDGEVQLTYRTATDDERAWLDANTDAVSEILDFRSMAVVDREPQAERGLTQVKAVDDAYPLYGTVQLQPEIQLGVALKGNGLLPGGVMDRVLVDRLGLSVGDTFRLGTQDFALTAVLTYEPDNAGSGFSLGPRTIVKTADLRESGLIQPGTLFESAYRLKIPTGTDLNEMESQVRSIVEGGGMRWRDSRNGAPGMARFVDRLSTFLIIVGLAGLAVGGVGVSAAVRSYLNEKVHVIATLKSLGADSRTIMLVYLFQIGALTALGIILGLILGAALPLALAPIIETRLPVPAILGVYSSPLAEAAFYGGLAAIIFTIWPLARTENIRAATLFRDAALGATGLPRTRYIMMTGIVLFVLVFSAAYLSGEIRLVLWAAVGIGGAFAVLVLAAQALRFLASGMAHWHPLRGHTSFRLALASVGGPGGDAISVVLSLGLGLSVLAAVGQIDANMRGAIARDLPDIAPSFFVVDIQSNQMDGFRARMDSDAGIKDYESAPMLRGVITQINGKPAKETAGDHWVISGDRGITYAAEKPGNTKITEGNWWPAQYSGEPQISFSAEEAEEMGLALGDTMTVNVLGRDIVGTITSFREVDFSNAGMGFVLSMNPSAISGAPHTHIATIYADQSAEASILRDLTTSFPNITAISVRDGIQRFTEVLTGIAAAITFGAMATLLTGVVVLIGAAAAGERARTYEASILKTLGASRATVLANFSIRSAILGMAAGIVAIFSGGIAGWAVSKFVMETEFRFEPWSAIAIVIGGVVLTMLASAAFSLRALNQRPAQILRSRE